MDRTKPGRERSLEPTGGRRTQSQDQEAGELAASHRLQSLHERISKLTLINLQWDHQAREGYPDILLKSNKKALLPIVLNVTFFLPPVQTGDYECCAAVQRTSM